MTSRLALPASAHRVLHRLRLLKSDVLSLVTLLPLLLSARSRAATEVWFGDSHAMCFNGPRTTRALSRGADGQFVVYLGPRLMYSLARDGFPPLARRIARLLGRVARRGTVVTVFCSGEIDVRCHLVPRAAQDPEPLAFVPQYVDGCLGLAREAGARAALFMAPPPPSITCPVLPEFPIRGTIDERIAMRHQLSAALGDASGAASGLQVAVVDAAPALTDESGGMDPHYTDDGCHTNAAGIRVARQVVSPAVSAMASA